MRCIVGFVLFVVLYFGSCKLLGAAARQIAIANDGRHSSWAGQAAEADILKRYHALVAVAAGVLTLAACSVPTILAHRNRHKEEWYG